MLRVYVCILFIYIPQLHFAEKWRCDGYRWYQNGIKNIPRKNPVIKKTYFILKTFKQFQTTCVSATKCS